MFIVKRYCTRDSSDEINYINKMNPVRSYIDNYLILLVELLLLLG